MTITFGQANAYQLQAGRQLTVSPDANYPKETFGESSEGTFEVVKGPRPLIGEEKNNFSGFNYKIQLKPINSRSTPAWVGLNLTNNTATNRYGDLQVTEQFDSADPKNSDYPQPVKPERVPQDTILSRFRNYFGL